MLNCPNLGGMATLFSLRNLNCRMLVQANESVHYILQKTCKLLILEELVPIFRKSIRHSLNNSF